MEEEPNAKDPVVKAATSDDYSLGSFGKRSPSDFVGKLYADIVKDSEPLKELEKEHSSLRAGKEDSIEAFQKYMGYNEAYFASARQHLQSVSDSVLKAKLAALIDESEKVYKGSASGLVSLNQQIDLNSNRLAGLHEALMISVTLPAIIKYSKESLPQAAPMQKYFEQQKKVMERTGKAIATNGG
jgi:hypothetical protein